MYWPSTEPSLQLLLLLSCWRRWLINLFIKFILSRCFWYLICVHWSELFLHFQYFFKIIFIEWYYTLLVFFFFFIFFQIWIFEWTFLLVLICIFSIEFLISCIRCYLLYCLFTSYLQVLFVFLCIWFWLGVRFFNFRIVIFLPMIEICILINNDFGRSIIFHYFWKTRKRLIWNKKSWSSLD